METKTLAVGQDVYINGGFGPVGGIRAANLTKYRVVLWFDLSLQSEVVDVDSLQEAVALLKSAGDSIGVIENNVPRLLNSSEEEEIRILRGLQPKPPKPVPENPEW
jgi:hypothetical protein